LLPRRGGFSAIFIEEKSMKRSQAKKAEPQKVNRYLVIVFGDVDPHLQGPYKSDATRLTAARRHRKEEDGDLNDGMYRLDIDAKGRPTIGAFGGDEVDVGDDE